MLDITVNGESRRFESQLNLDDLVDRLALRGKKLAIERNGEIVPRSSYAATPLASGDQLEIVVAVGGG
jgi:sulfur carrier protein